MTHVQVPLAAKPLLALLHAEGRDEPQAGFAIREDSDDPRPALDLLVEPLQAVGGPDLAAVRLWEREVGQGFLDALLDPARQRRVRLAPAVHDVPRESRAHALSGAAYTAFRSCVR